MFLGAFGYQDGRFSDRYQHPKVNKLLGFFILFLSSCKSLGASRHLLTRSHWDWSRAITWWSKVPKDISGQALFWISLAKSIEESVSQASGCRGRCISTLSPKAVAHLFGLMDCSSSHFHPPFWAFSKADQPFLATCALKNIPCVWINSKSWKQYPRLKSRIKLACMFSVFLKIFFIFSVLDFTPRNKHVVTIGDGYKFLLLIYPL